MKADSADPFTLTLLDLPTNVVVGNLGNPLTLDSGASVKTGITFDGSGGIASLNVNSATWGNGTTPTAFPIVPEPASGLMACVAALGLLGLRRRR